MTVNANVPAWSAAPETRPPAESALGSAPPLTANVTAPEAPVVESCWLYGAPVEPPGSELGSSAIAELLILTVPAGPVLAATGALPQSRAATDCTVIVPVPVGPTAATSSVNSEPPWVAPHGEPSSTTSTV